MKRTAGALAVFFLTLASAYAQDRIDLVAPKNPRSMAMGGAFVAMSTGFQGFYGNPASFASAETELTLLSVVPWVYVSPTQANIATLASAIGSAPEEMVQDLSGLITSNGIGAGASVGTGWVGKGLGLGIVGSVDSYVRGNNALGAMGSLDGQLAGIVGVGFPLDLFGLKLSIGGDLRPFLRMTGPISSVQLAGIAVGAEDPLALIGGLPVFVGFGLAVDLGARLDFARFASIGLAVRDISTRQSYAESTFGDVLHSLASGESIPESSSADYAVLPNITLGASMRPLPEGMRGILDLLLVLELQDPVKVIQEKATFWHLVHMGMEADILGGLLSLRGGLNKGYFSLGLGLDLLVIQANLAVFTEELGKRPGDLPRTGVSAEFAIRF